MYFCFLGETWNSLVLEVAKGRIIGFLACNTSNWICYLLGFGMEAFFLLIVAFANSYTTAMAALILAVSFSGFAISGIFKIFLWDNFRKNQRVQVNLLFLRLQCESPRYRSKVCKYSDGTLQWHWNNLWHSLSRNCWIYHHSRGRDLLLLILTT